VGPLQLPQKAHWDTLHQTCVFASGRICESRSAFRCIRGPKRRSTFFVFRWDQYGFHKSCIKTRYAELLFLHLVGSTCHIVRSGASRARNHDALVFMLESAPCCFHKKHVRTHYAELVFLHLVGFVGHVVHSAASGVRKIDALFFILRWTGMSSTKSTPGHVTPNLCFCIWWDLQVT
jgi:hypothetical protein